MTAHELIADIFSRHQDGVAGNVRRLSRKQIDFLLNLIDADEEGGAVRRGLDGSLVWMPAGREKYVITEDVKGNKHTIARLSNLRPSGMGSLF